jgi:phage baseplate assembly protein W
MLNAKDFLGRGWSFTIDVDIATGKVKMSEFEQDISEAIRIILSTKRGERIMRPDFGCDLHEYLFELDSASIRGRIIRSAADALTLWEPRISGVDVNVDFRGHGGFLLEIAYTVRSTNNRFNLVYPFYLSEGS